MFTKAIKKYITKKEFEKHCNREHGELYTDDKGNILNCQDPNCEYINKMNK